jgi:hypothetical protein
MGPDWSIRTAIALAIVVLAGCTSTVPVRVGDDVWTADCVNVSADDCAGIVRMFTNNLAWNYGWVQQESGGTVQVSPAAACPAFSDLARPGACWRANALTHGSRACMVMARRKQSEQGYDFIRIGGDDLTGNVSAPAPGTTPC